MPEHAQREEAEGKNPVDQGYAAIDTASMGTDAIMDGGVEASSWEEMTHQMGHHALKALSGDASKATTAYTGVTAVLAPLSIGMGIKEMIDGFHEGGREGAFGVAGGATGVASGGTAVAGLAGVGGAATAAPLIAAGGAGLKLGHYGDNRVKEEGWLHDNDGNATTASGWAASNGQAADDWVTRKTGIGALGTVAGLGTTLGSSIVGSGVAVGAAGKGALLGGYSVVSGGAHTLTGLGHDIGSGFANRHRASHYNDMFDHVEGGASSLADTDDAQRTAVERSKREHPERWGENPTWGGFMSEAAHGNVLKSGKK
jgi:hypothetical protein